MFKKTSSVADNSSTNQGKQTSRKFLTILLLTVFFVSGYGIGAVRSYGNTVPGTSGKLALADASHADLGVLWKTWSELEKRFLPPTDSTVIPTPQERIYGAAQGLARSYNDPYTVFFPPEETAQFEEEVDGLFGGIGAEIGFNDNDELSVVSVLPNTPAATSGLRSGDVILAIDEVKTEGVSVIEAVKEIRGETGTTVILTILRADPVRQVRDVEIERAIIAVPVLEMERLDNETLLVELYTFPADMRKEFASVVTEYNSGGYSNLIIDVRQNPGGYLDAAIDLSSYFLADGKVVLQQERKEATDTFRSKGYKDFRGTPNLVVLVDGGSASAAEIFAGAIKEHNQGEVVGETTYGKGSVQEYFHITDTTSLKVTTARWLTPQGNSISGNGLEPTIKVSETASAAFNEYLSSLTTRDYDKAKDPWLEAAQETF